MYWSRRRWSDRVKLLQLPLFAGYLFCRFDPSHRARILATPGVFFIAGIGKTPLPVDPEEIEAIRLAVNCGGRVEPWNRLQVGHTVRIEQGPLSGLTGVLLRWKGGNHLILNVQLLQRGVAVEVDESWVLPCDPVAASPNPYVLQVPIQSRGWRPERN
jgi:transcription termination/antitermination protein NusG